MFRAFNDKSKVQEYGLFQTLEATKLCNFSHGWLYQYLTAIISNCNNNHVCVAQYSFLVLIWLSLPPQVTWHPYTGLSHYGRAFHQFTAHGLCRGFTGYMLVFQFLSNFWLPSFKKFVVYSRSLFQPSLKQRIITIPAARKYGSLLV